MIYMIALIKNTNNRLIGFRILGTNTNETKDASIASIVHNLYEGVCIENLVMQETCIRGFNGQLGKYPTLVLDKEAKLSPNSRSQFIILYRTEDGYIVSDYKGIIQNITNEEAMEYTNSQGIANAVIVRYIDGTKVIQPIEGAYPLKLTKNRYSNIKVNEYNINNINNINAKLAMLNMNYRIDNKLRLIVTDKQLTSIAVPEGIREVYFKNCMQLKEVVLPESIEKLQPQSFYACCELQSIYLPQSIKIIPYQAFKSCTSLEHINLQHIKIIGEQSFSYCGMLVRISFSESLEEIHKECFSGCSGIEYVNLQKITKIGAQAFEYCTKLEEVKLSASIRIIPKNTFYNCTYLREINLQNVKMIDSKAFMHCKSLKNIDITNVKYLENDAFKYTKVKI